MQSSDWSSDVCSSDLIGVGGVLREGAHRAARLIGVLEPVEEHMVIGGVVADARARTMLPEEVGRFGHRFHAARDDKVDAASSEERRVGKVCVSTCSSRCSTCLSIKKNTNKSNT